MGITKGQLYSSLIGSFSNFHFMFKIDDYKMSDGKLRSFSDVGCYPIFYLCADSGVLCPKCCNENLELLTDKDDKQWCLTAADINWEDASLTCDHCSQRIESAYAEDQ